MSEAMAEIVTFEDLERVLEAENPAETEAGHKWVCDTPGKANWMLELLAADETQDAKDCEVARDQIERANAWLDRRQSRRASNRQWIEAHLERYTREQHEATGKTHIGLPFGECQLRKQQIVLKSIIGDGPLIDWLKKHQPDFVRVKEELDRTKLRNQLVAPKNLGERMPATLKETGEVIDGLTVERPRELKFSCKAVEKGVPNGD